MSLSLSLSLSNKICLNNQSFIVLVVSSELQPKQEKGGKKRCTVAACLPKRGISIVRERTIIHRILIISAFPACGHADMESTAEYE